jgi:hypothetical protein
LKFLNVIENGLKLLDGYILIGLILAACSYLTGDNGRRVIMKLGCSIQNYHLPHYRYESHQLGSCLVVQDSFYERVISSSDTDT